MNCSMSDSFYLFTVALNKSEAPVTPSSSKVFLTRLAKTHVPLNKWEQGPLCPAALGIATGSLRTLLSFRQPLTCRTFHPLS